MVTRKDFIEKLIEKIDKEIDEKLKERLEDYGGEQYIRIFLSLNPNFLTNTEVQNHIVDNISSRGLNVTNVKASSDVIPKTMVEIML